MHTAAPTVADEEGHSKQRQKDSFRKFWQGMLTQKYLTSDNQPVPVLPHLYIGSIGAGANWDALCELGITYVLVASETVAFTFESSKRFEYLRVGVPDDPSAQIIDFFDQSNAFIARGRDGGNHILVHCFAGKSRSATLVLAYLIAAEGHSYESALAVLRQTRPQAQPNHGHVGYMISTGLLMFVIDLPSS
ncbi:Aste57867_18510 [Aphanomyces stellatus]|uniref:protein-tyrosine-phosphatase n=1 Tax=Aphanomyces stellatus TaxID=120398 RepID=A0A485LAA8_9STRA|nr:hypothetical protein As57867_018448 [Aphanomyces stellatus]VFT95246.1 Aste57867_18510 [Aphanomyces stellatus]